MKVMDTRVVLSRIKKKIRLHKYIKFMMVCLFIGAWTIFFWQIGGFNEFKPEQPEIVSDTDGAEDSGDIWIVDETEVGWVITVDTYTEDVYNDTSTLEYDPQEINNQVVQDVMLYFNINNYSGFSVHYEKHMDWMNSYFNHETNELFLGLSGIENDSKRYKLLFTHEYSHYVLYQLGLTADNLHEALADTFTWFEEPIGQREIWGTQDENRHWPYNIIMKDIITNFYCLDDVYKVNNKISKISDYLNRLEGSCGVSMTNILNEIDWGGWGMVVTSED